MGGDEVTGEEEEEEEGSEMSFHCSFKLMQGCEPLAYFSLLHFL